MVKEAYETLRKEHPILPEYDKLNREFTIYDIDKDDLLLKQIKQKIADTLEPIIQLIEHTLSPDPNSLSDMYECRTFTDGEKKQIVEVFRRLMQNFRLLLETDLIGEDKTDAETIKKIYDSWITDKRQIVPIIKKLRESWSKQVEAKEILEYLG